MGKLAWITFLVGCSPSTPLASLTDRALELDVRSESMTLQVGKDHDGTCPTLGSDARATLNGVPFHVVTLGGPNTTTDGPSCLAPRFELLSTDWKGLDHAVVQIGDASRTLTLTANLAQRAMTLTVPSDYRILMQQPIEALWSEPTDTLDLVVVTPEASNPQGPDIEAVDPSSAFVTGPAAGVLRFPGFVFGTPPPAPGDVDGILVVTATVLPAADCAEGCRVVMMPPAVDIPVRFANQ